ncbi:MAG: hypothetical protein LUG23_00480 [Oscillospiraceae bacterium]|nr:hypothetical protein [Oscillospiraceae bacterium]
MKKEQESAEKQKKKCCPKWLKIVGVIVIAIVLVFGIPILINESYKANCGYVTMWSASDMLAFYGAILAAILAGIGVYVSIWYSNKNYREDVRARILPFITVTTLERKAATNVSALLREQVEGKSAPENVENKPNVQQEEKRLDRIYFIIDSNGIKAQSTLNKYQQTVSDLNGIASYTTTEGTDMLHRVDYFSIPLEVENVGNGTAVNLRIGFNYADDKKSHEFLTPTMLNQKQTIYINIFSTENPENIHGEYLLEFFYEDIHRNKYTQQFPVTMEKDEKGQEIQSIELVGEQKRI